MAWRKELILTTHTHLQEKKVIAKLKLLESGLVREAQAIDEFYVKLKGGKKKDSEDMEDDEMGDDVFSNAEEYEAHLGKLTDWPNDRH